ncbi:MAG: 3-phosphoshikimate 1-carboxyvinyltransferase [Myxococcota bacterium]|jgi:3-phosphoshikimate 1-carboxyvinyltransferase
MMAEISPKSTINGSVRVPGDKSISHRVLMFGALADGVTRASNLAPGADVRSTGAVLRQLGVDVTVDGDQAVVHGLGVRGFSAASEPLDCGNSGTTMRLMMGVLAGMDFNSELIGDASLSGRPMRRVSIPLEAMGAQCALTDGHAPVRITGSPLAGRRYESPIASAQVKSAIVLAGLFATGRTEVVEPARSRDHTERMLSRMGANLSIDKLTVGIEKSDLKSLESVVVAGDLSSAAFLIAAGLLLDGDGLTIRGAGVNPTRTGILDALAQMGATIDRVAEREQAGEPVADLVVRKQALRGTELRGELVVRAIDEVPILAVLATQAVGRTVIADAGELRVKESDRLKATHRMLTDMGATISETPDGLIIDGPTPLHAARVDSVHDHRIAMAAAVAGLIAAGTTTIDGAEVVDVSYPGFFQVLDELTQ